MLQLTLLIGLACAAPLLGNRRKRYGNDKGVARIRAGISAVAAPLCARNTPWFKRNPWFEHKLLPVLRERIQSLHAR